MELKFFFNFLIFHFDHFRILQERVLICPVVIAYIYIHIYTNTCKYHTFIIIL